MSREVRAWIYSILIAVGPVVAFYGLATQEEIALWLGVGGTILGGPAGSLALKNLSPKKPAEAPEVSEDGEEFTGSTIPGDGNPPYEPRHAE